MLRQLIHRPIAVTMVLIAVMVLGISAVKLLPVSLAPDVDVPQITVQVSSANMSARELNESVIAPLRRQLTQVSHLNDIRTEAKNGSGVISLYFDYDGDIDYLFIEVNEKIDRAMSSLPESVDRPKVVKMRASDIPAFYLNVTLRNDTPGGEGVSPEFSAMSNYVSQVISRRVEQLTEVAMVDVSGLVYPEILIVPDIDRLRSLRITGSQLENAINGGNIRLGNLTIRDGEYQYNVRFEASMGSRKDIEEIYLNIDGRLYQIKELARVQEQSQPRTGLVVSDGKDAVTLAVIKRSEAQMADLRKAMNDLTADFERSYPDLEFTVTRDQTALLDYSINNLLENILVGALLAVAVIFLFMQSFRTSLLIVITIPTALIISLLGFYILGISINIISLAGLIMGVGMMVDNSIIVIDNITYHWQAGKKLQDAVVIGAREVFAPMLSSVLTTCAVFVPLIFMSGIAGALFYDQAMAVTLTLFSSLLVSVLVIPVFYYMFYRKKSHYVTNRYMRRLSLNNLVGLYERILKWFFRRRWIIWLSLGVSVVGIVLMFMYIPKERLPEISHNDALLRISWNERITVDENRRRCEALVEQLGGLTEQSTIMAGVQQFVLGHTDETSISEATVYIAAEGYGQIQEAESKAAGYVRSNYPKAVFSAGTSGNIFDMIFAGNEAKLVARLRPVGGGVPTPLELNDILEQISGSLPDVTIQPAEWEEYIEYIARPEMIALYDVSYNDILSELRSALNDNRIMTIVQGNFSVPVVVGENKSDVREIIDNSYIRRTDGDIPLGVLVRETRNRDLKNITGGREGEYYHLDLDMKDRMVPQAMETIRGIVREDGRFDVDFTGGYFTNRNMIGKLTIILIIAVLLLYFILASQFESLVQPLIILAELTIDIFGVLVVMLCAGVSLNLMSIIGIIVMCGIVINDSILKVDTLNQIRKQGRSLMYAVLDAGRRRLKPILMTSLSTILAMVPFLTRGDMGSDLQYPLSIALIGGMVVGTLVSIFFIPLIYFDIYKKRPN